MDILCSLLVVSWGLPLSIFQVRDASMQPANLIQPSFHYRLGWLELLQHTMCFVPLRTFALQIKTQGGWEWSSRRPRRLAWELTVMVFSNCKLLGKSFEILEEKGWRKEKALLRTAQMNKTPKVERSDSEYNHPHVLKALTHPQEQTLTEKCRFEEWRSTPVLD